MSCTEKTPPLEDLVSVRPSSRSVTRSAPSAASDEDFAWSIPSPCSTGEEIEDHMAGTRKSDDDDIFQF